MAQSSAMFEHAARNRRLAADLVERLTPAELDSPSLCAGWPVRTVAGHLTMPFHVGFLRMLAAAARHRSLHVASGRFSDDLGRRPPAEIARVLREHADDHLQPPGVGAGGPMSDTAIHLCDMTRPLGRPSDVSAACWTAGLDYLVTPRARRGFVRAAWLDGLTWRSDDPGWSHGSGPEVAGSGEAVAMVMTGRTAYLDDVTGPGVEVLRGRIDAREP